MKKNPNHQIIGTVGGLLPIITKWTGWVSNPLHAACKAVSLCLSTCLPKKSGFVSLICKRKIFFCTDFVTNKERDGISETCCSFFRATTFCTTFHSCYLYFSHNSRWLLFCQQLPCSAKLKTDSYRHRATPALGLPDLKLTYKREVSGLSRSHCPFTCTRFRAVACVSIYYLF